jgi:hypothetical protein
MDIVLPIRIIVAVAKVCIDTFNDSIQLNSETKRLGNHVRYLVAEVPVWSEHIISANNRDGLNSIGECT